MESCETSGTTCESMIHASPSRALPPSFTGSALELGPQEVPELRWKVPRFLQNLQRRR